MNTKFLLPVVALLACLTVTPAHATSKASCCSAPTTMTPTQFAQTVATIDMLEIKLGQVAQTNSNSAAVKKFGQRMIIDHTNINKNLTSVTASQHITIPTKLDAKHQAIVKKLSGLKGSAFNNAYIPAMVTGHTQALAMFKNQSTTCANAALKKFARQTTPIIALHLKLAKAVHAGLK
ncbi:MAG: DUF4142 domain-containing protein [Chthoniobacterales bacterium]